MFNLTELAPHLLKAVLKARLPDIERAITKKFKQGELVQGKVIEVLGKKGAVVRMKDVDLIAKTPRPLTPGQPIMVKVDRVSPQFMVTLLPSDTPVQEKAAALLRLYLPQARPAGTMVAELARVIANLPKEALKGSGINELLEELRTIFTGAEEKKEAKELPVRMRGDVPKGTAKGTPKGAKKGMPAGATEAEQVEVREREEAPGRRGRRRGSVSVKDRGRGEKVAVKKNVMQLMGLSHEAELVKGAPKRNLKSALLIIQKNLELLSEKEPEKYTEPIAKVVSTLRNIELRQLSGLDDGRAVKSWDIPIWNGQDETTAKIYISRDSEGKGGKGRAKGFLTKVSLKVDMSSLGPVRAEFTASEKSISGTIYLADEAHVELAKDRLVSLNEGLAKFGYESTFAVRAARREFLTEDIGSDLELPASGLLSVKV